MRSHISVHRDTTKYFSNSFIFKPKIEKEGLPSDSPAGLGAGGLRFESGRPDHLLLYCQWTVPDTLAWRLNLGPIWLQIQLSPRFLLRSFDWSTYRRLNVSQKNRRPNFRSIIGTRNECRRRCRLRLKLRFQFRILMKNGSHRSPSWPARRQI